MISAFQKNKRLNTCAGIEIRLLADHGLKLSVCVIELVKNELLIKQKFEAATIEEVIKKLPESTPVAVNITGRGVLLKKVAIDHNGLKHDSDIYFPHLQQEQFYIQYFDNHQDSWASIIRRQIADQLVDTFQKNKVDVLNVSVGPFVTAHTLRQINVYGEELVFDGHVVKISQAKEWDDYSFELGKNSSFPIKIGIEPLGEQFLIAYSTAFQLALHQSLSLLRLEKHESEYLFEEYLQKAKFRRNAITFLMALFSLLLVNFMVLQYYTVKNNELLLRVNNNTADADQIKDKEENIKRNEELLKDLGWSHGVSFAWLADQVGQTVPANIILSELDINPIEEGRLKRNNYQQGLINIKGKTAILSSVNNWLDTLQEKSWVKQVELKNFSALDDEGKQQFTILIQY